MKIYPVFHISLLEPVSPDILEGPAPEIYLDTQEEEFEVERILDVRTHRRRLQWLVKWVGYGNENNTWEPKENLTHCQKALEKFHQEKRPGRAPRKQEALAELRPPPVQECSTFPAPRAPSVSFVSSALAYADGQHQPRP
jgi:hypothetical protein